MLPVWSQAVLSEEELVEQASATAAEVSGSMMRIKLELEEKKRTVNMLQAALVGAGTHTHYCRFKQRGGFLVLLAAVDDPLNVLPCPSGPAEGADSKTREGDREGAEQELPAPEGSIRSHHPETPHIH